MRILLSFPVEPLQHNVAGNNVVGSMLLVCSLIIYQCMHTLQDFLGKLVCRACGPINVGLEYSRPLLGQRKHLLRFWASTVWKLLFQRLFHLSWGMHFCWDPLTHRTYIESDIPYTVRTNLRTRPLHPQDIYLLSWGCQPPPPSPDRIGQKHCGPLRIVSGTTLSRLA